ncbi:MAG: hypothetical protein WDN23_21725 [Edaphobacter sp.]
MRPTLRILFGAITLAASFAAAQMHKVAKPEQVVRAVGVYEWTGDLAKPTASRLIPVSLYIEGKLEDAGIYIARPIPFALLPGNVYILQTAGVDKATLDLAYARHLQAVESTGDLAFDDGWFGYGTVKPLAVPRRATPLKPSKNTPVIATSSSGPHFGSKPADSASTTTPGTTKPDATTPSSTSASTATPSTDDPDRPTMKRRDSSGTTTTASSGSTPSSTTSPTTTGSTSSSGTTSTTTSDDPDRPTLIRRSPTTDSTTSTGSTSTASNTPAGTDDPDRPTLTRHSPTTSTTDSTSATDPTSTTASNSGPAPSGSDDPDRPTLKRHSPEDAKRAGVSSGSAVSAVGDLNDDPNRPNLHHGKPTSAMTETELPRLTGVPSNLHQSVAVSDAVNRDPHPFTLEWDDENQHQAILKKMQDLAQAQLAAYSKPTTSSAATTPAKKPTPTTHTATRKPAPSPPAQPLLDEELKAYTLSYGGAATYVYTANTGGTGAALRYVTIVAQADGMGDLKPAIQSVTDAAHLDRTPRMNFVDVVDAEASNRASLLFELRSKNARQFALYRVIASHPEQIFLTGTTQ